MAGKHFLSAGLIGAEVGTATGLIFPAIHADPAEKLRPTIAPGGARLAFTWD